jgi:hypothetical protein
MQMSYSCQISYLIQLYRSGYTGRDMKLQTQGRSHRKQTGAHPCNWPCATTATSRPKPLFIGAHKDQSVGMCLIRPYKSLNFASLLPIIIFQSDAQLQQPARVAPADTQNQQLEGRYLKQLQNPNGQWVPAVLLLLRLAGHSSRPAGRSLESSATKSSGQESLVGSEAPSLLPTTERKHHCQKGAEQGANDGRPLPPDQHRSMSCHGLPLRSHKMCAPAQTGGRTPPRSRCKIAAAGARHMSIRSLKSG